MYKSLWAKSTLHRARERSLSTIWIALTSAIVCAALLFGPVAFAQVVEVPEGVLLEPLNDSDAVQLLNAGKPAEFPLPALGEIPFFTYTTTASRNGRIYEGSIVGGSPFSTTSNNTTTTVKVVIVPVVLKFNFGGGRVFTQSPTAGDPGCIGSHTALSLTQASPL